MEIINYQTVFTAQDIDFSIFTILPIIFFIAAVLITILFFKVKIEEENNKLFARLFGSVFSLVALYILVTETPEKFQELHKFKDIFETGQYETVEGEIQNFKEYHDKDIYGGGSGYWNNKFSINDVSFHLKSNSHFENRYNKISRGYFYEIPAELGSPIKANGQKVRLTYIIENEDNKIIKVEIISF